MYEQVEQKKNRCIGKKQCRELRHAWRVKLKSQVFGMPGT